ncbi:MULTISPECIES: hypothetical protein [Flavobacterium]|uniref:hypothetical protein n=1 Tax=Flavobacterium TaxID=237 RepID=UPI001403F4FF|nr:MULTISPECIES: hypothetical protein [Flavobacterium]QKJ62085.1 hypothetical protein HQN62_02695 [Flavobacterium sp. M31R6]
MSKKEKEKKNKKDKKKELLKKIKVAENCKSSCCEKYMKSEKKRCSRCPMFDLLKKTA